MATQTIQNETVLPQWYQDYLQQVMGRGLSAAGEEYQPYTGQRIAGLTPEQESAYGYTKDMFGLQGDTLNQAKGLYGDAATAGNGSFDQASGMFTSAGGKDTAGLATPYLQQGSALANQAAGGSSLAGANPYIQQSVAPIGLAGAQPYLSQASQTFPGAVDQYMSPYNQQVTDRIAQLGARNLSESLLPQISDQFVRAGQFGSAQQRDVVGRALRDTQESVLGQQAQALESGYGTAGQLFNQDQSRLAGIGGTAGQLGTSQQQILQNAGLGIGSLQSGDLSRQLSAGQTLGQFGLGQSSAAAADAARQIQAAQGISGIGQAQNQAALAAAQGLDSHAANAQNLGFQQIAALEATGNAQQAQNQKGLDTAYSDYKEQQQYPWQQVGNLSNVVQGLPVNQSSTQTVTGAGPSTTSQIAGLGLGVAGLANSGLFKAKGGAVRKKVKYKSAHSYGNTPRRGIDFMEAA